MTKTPDEIKMGLELCAKDECFGDREGCPYNSELAECVGKMCMDALVYIRQLEAERDAAVKDLSFVRECRVCKHYGCRACDDPCRSCGVRNDNWEWRGLPEPPKEGM